MHMQITPVPTSVPIRRQSHGNLHTARRTHSGPIKPAADICLHAAIRSGATCDSTSIPSPVCYRRGRAGERGERWRGGGRGGRDGRGGRWRGGGRGLGGLRFAERLRGGGGERVARGGGLGGGGCGFGGGGGRREALQSGSSMSAKPSLHTIVQKVIGVG
jgi:hypothetical protein